MANLLQGLGMAKPVSEFTGAAMQYGQFKQQTELRDMQIKKEKAALAEQQKQNEYLDQEVDFRMTPFYLSLPDEAKPRAEEAFKKIGVFDDNYRGTRRGMYKGLEEISKNKEAFTALMQPVVEAKAKKVVSAFEKWQKNPEDPKLKAEYDSLSADYHASSGKLLEWQKSQAKPEEEKGFTLSPGQKRFDAEGKEIATGAEKEATPVWKESPDPDSPTGFSYVDQNSGKKGSPAPPPKSAVEINFDKETIKGVIKALPKMKEKSANSVRGLQRIDQMLGLLDKGAGGRMWQVKAWLAPNLEALGIKSQGLSDAQLYETLARTLGGSFRMEIVGPGQVSDYENRLLQAISGGGGTATAAARELLQYYRGVAQTNIDDYRDAVGAVSEVSPAAAKVYPLPPANSAPKTIKYDAQGNRVSQ